MAGIAEPLRPARVLAKPKRFPPFKSFSCGLNGKPWEKSVNEWARALYHGMETPVQTVIVVEDANRKLVGFCILRPEPAPSGIDKHVSGSQCVHMLGTDRLCQGTRLEDGSRPGDALLRGVLEQIKTANDGRMPYVWALVPPENKRSRALFDRHGFDELPYSGTGETIRLRAPDERPPQSTKIHRGRVASWIAPKGKEHRSDRRTRRAEH